MGRFIGEPITVLFLMIWHGVVVPKSQVPPGQASTAAKALAMWKLQQQPQSVNSR